MKGKNVVWRCCAVMALGILCGCKTVTVPPEPTPRPNSPKPALEAATSELMSAMLSSAAFKRDYTEAERIKGRRLIIVVGRIEPEMHNKHPDCEIVRDRVQVLLNEPGLFVVKMDGFDEAFDYQVTGSVKADYDAVNNCDVNPRLHLKILDANSGQIIWSDTQYILKL